jgi:hypothetical protein
MDVPIDYKLFMPKEKAKLPADSERRRQKDRTWAEDQETRPYYYDDALGYQEYSDDDDDVEEEDDDNRE